MDQNERKFIDPITTPTLLGLLGIGLVEIFKAAVGFFAWIAIKRWWDKWQQRRRERSGEPDRPLSGEESE